jgi:hypothetical protein
MNGKSGVDSGKLIPRTLNSLPQSAFSQRFRSSTPPCPRKNDRRCYDRRDGGYEWQDRGIGVRPNQKQLSGSRAEEQRHEHASMPAPLCDCGGPIGDVALSQRS